MPKIGVKPKREASRNAIHSSLTLGNKDGYSMLVNDGYRDTVAEVALT